MYTNLYSFGKDHAQEGGANSRKWARTMLQSNIMYTPKNFFLWIGGCEQHSDCGTGAYCGESKDAEERGLLWPKWCQPCDTCEDDEYDFEPIGGRCPASCDDDGRDEL